MTRTLPRPPRGGLSLLEVLITMVILVTVMGPVLLIFGSATRVGHAADRMLRATLHAQVLLDAFTQLGPDELPITAGGETELYRDGSGLAAGGGGRYLDEIPAFLASPAPVEARRRIVAEQLPDGPVTIRVELEWDAHSMAEAPERKLVLEGLATPTLWR